MNIDFAILVVLEGIFKTLNNYLRFIYIKEMSECLEIQGGKPLNGVIKVSGAKNAALPMLMASLLTSQKVVYRNVPNLADVAYTKRLLEHFGAQVDWHRDVIEVQAEKIKAKEASYSLVKALRASFWILGPLLARVGAARVALPGGDAIGTRPVDMHLSGLTKMGADIKLKHGVVYATAPNGLKPAKIDFSFPSVGATHQILMAAALTPGVTTLTGVAREPEVLALCDLLTSMGANVEGAGSSKIEIEGQDELGAAQVDLIGDRIEAGTYLCAAAATGGEVTVTGIKPEYLPVVLDLFEQMGLGVQTTENSITVKRDRALKPVSISTGPFPQFATDLQAPFMAALTLTDGMSHIEENIFEGRFGHVSELNRMGAKIVADGRSARIEGVATLSSAPVEGGDIRGAASLLIAALAAKGTTVLHEIEHLRRGYESLEQKLLGVGARVSCRPEQLEDCISIGC